MVEKNMRYFACRGEPRYPAITRFVGESGMIYGSDGSSCEANQNLRWHEENAPEVNEEEAIKIVGGRPWEPQSPATATQPAPTQTSGRPVWEMVIEDIHARNRFGIEKHGTPLQVDNGRDKLVDAYQEELDKCVYMRAWIEQRNAAVALLRESKQFCGTKAAEMIDKVIAMLMGGGK